MRINWNLNETQAFGASTPIFQPGEYLVEIVSEQENQPLKNGRGTALVLEYKVLEGNYSGQLMRDWLNVGHIDQTTREIAQRRIKAICEAVGLSTITDTRQMFNRPFYVVVSLSEFNGRQRNSIDDYRPANVQTSFAHNQPTTFQAVPAQQPQQAAQQFQPQANNGPFWQTHNNQG